MIYRTSYTISWNWSPLSNTLRSHACYISPRVGKFTKGKGFSRRDRSSRSLCRCRRSRNGRALPSFPLSKVSWVDRRVDGSPRRDRNRVGAELNLADVFIGREGGRQCSAAKCRGVGIVEGWGCCVAAQHLYTTISPAHDKSPVAVRPPLSYRRSYFNILKFYPKCAVYQNFYHKLLARLSSPYLPVSLFYSLCPLSSRTRTCPFDPRTWKINGRCRRISRFEPSFCSLSPHHCSPL